MTTAAWFGWIVTVALALGAWHAYAAFPLLDGLELLREGALAAVVAGAVWVGLAAWRLRHIPGRERVSRLLRVGLLVPVATLSLIVLANRWIGSTGPQLHHAPVAGVVDWSAAGATPGIGVASWREGHDFEVLELPPEVAEQVRAAAGRGTCLHVTTRIGGLGHEWIVSAEIGADGPR